ncbi:Coronin-7 [Actinomortierella ambigua]|uniref:Coronin n=1 Tax=Actinomortierella ambigua TaxID=1343610 RepID=A0A9P6U351_9FUNG|nr:Coronin-7 [Actinomortierella ambigua]
MSRRLFSNFSKYRHSIGKVAKADDAYLDVRASSSASSEASNLVKVSSQWIAVKWADGVGTVGLVPVDTVGRVGNDVSLLRAHGSAVTDWDFSPFDPLLLVTGSESGEVKVWKLAEDKGSDHKQILTIQPQGGRSVESVVFHPTAQGILATVCGTTVQVWDIDAKTDGSTLSTATYTLVHPNQVFSVSWKTDGTLLATSCKDTKVRVFDVRKQEQPIQEGQSHAGNRSSRVAWLGEKDLLLTIGYNRMREREISLWKASDLSRPLEVRSMSSSSGLMMPLFDEDTDIVFLPSRGEALVRWIEISENTPHLTEGTPFSLSSPSAGAGLLPKQKMNVMQAEIARLITVGNNGLWPLSINVPRKSYLDFHADLYPDTKAAIPGLSAAEWLKGEDRPVPRVSLDPGVAGKPAWARSTHQPATSSPSPSPVSTTPSVKSPVPTLPPSTTPAAQPARPVSPPQVVPQPSTPTSELPEKTTAESPKIPAPAPAPQSPKASSAAPLPESPKPSSGSSSPAPSPSSPAVASRGASPAVSRIAMQKASKFRFLAFKPYHTSQHFESIKDLSISTLPECSILEVNPKYVALALSGSGGRVGVLRADEPGRVEVKIPSIVCGSDLTGFKFDPFDHHLLVTSSEDAKLKGWKIPEEGLDRENDTTTPTWTLGAGSMDKITTIAFHPRAKDVLLSASSDRGHPTIRLWDLKEQKEKVVIKAAHKDTIFSCAFNHDGTQIISIGKDKTVRLWDARTGQKLAEGPGHQSLKSSRVLWLGETDYALSVGYSRSSQREICLYDTRQLAQGPIEHKIMDTVPGVLVPHYDADTSILGLCARGDRAMKHFEIHVDRAFTGPERIAAVASLEMGTLQQDVGYWPKRYCNVREVELMRMYRLTYNSVEVIQVTVPRNKKEYFQDELFPDTIDVEQPSLDAATFFASSSSSGTVPAAPRIALCPPDMEPLSHHMANTPTTASTGGGNSLDKFLLGKQKVAEDERKKQSMERMFQEAKTAEPDRDNLVPSTGIVAEDEWDD